MISNSVINQNEFIVSNSFHKLSFKSNEQEEERQKRKNINSLQWCFLYQDF